MDETARAVAAPAPPCATTEELRAFQLHMVDTGTAPPTINATLSGLKFFFDVTLGHAELLVMATWRQAQRGHLSLGQLKVMSAIEQCRSAA